MDERNTAPVSLLLSVYLFDDHLNMHYALAGYICIVIMLFHHLVTLCLEYIFVCIKQSIPITASTMSQKKTLETYDVENLWYTEILLLREQIIV